MRIQLILLIFFLVSCSKDEEKPLGLYCGKVIKFYNSNYSQEEGNPCARPKIGSNEVALPGNGSHGIVVVNIYTENKKTFCLNFSATYELTVEGLGAVYCDPYYESW